MIVARVLGNIWATKKHPSLNKLKLLLVQALDPLTGQLAGDIKCAVDSCFGAGPGDCVLIVDEGSAARKILCDPKAPVRTIVCGIVDAASNAKTAAKYH